MPNYSTTDGPGYGSVQPTGYAYRQRWPSSLISSCSKANRPGRGPSAVTTFAGGHFAPPEEPELLAEDIVACFAELQAEAAQHE